MTFLTLLSVLGVAGIAVLAMAHPTAKNLATIKIGAIACVVAVVGALVWPEQAAAIGISVVVFALLAVLWRGITWPIRYIASAFASAFRRDP